MTRPISKMKIKNIVLTVTASAALSACGGGGGGGGASGSSASGGAAMSSASELSVTTSISSILSLISNKATVTAAATSTIIVSAVGQSAGGVGPIMQIYVGGRMIGSTEVTGSALKNYSFTTAAITTAAKVDVVFSNDAFINGEDRNLYVPNITVDGVPYASTDSGVTYDLGADAAAFDGVNVIAGQTEMYWGGALRFTVKGPVAVTTLTDAAPGYYVDQVNGNDANPGTIAAPWQTLSKLTSIKLATGEGMYLKCGGTWREPLTLGYQQLVDGAVIAGYGNCTTNKAVISGAISLLGGWTKNNNIWSRAVPAGTAKISRLYIDEQPYRTARWPNFTTYANDLALSSSASTNPSTTLLIDAAATSALQGIDLTGATVQVRTQPYEIETRTVSNSGNGSITISSATSTPMQAGVGYLVQDKLALLDAPGEFYHDVSANRIYVYPRTTAEQADMNSAGVEAAVRNQTLRLLGRQNLVVHDLEFRMSTADGLVAWDTPGIQVSNVVADRNLNAGISIAVFDPTITASSRATVTGSTLYENWNYGIDGRFMPLFDATNNLIVDTGTVDNSGWSQAAVALGDGARATGNTIQTSAFNGITFSGTGNSVVSSNYLTDYCARFTDCAGIYTWNGGKATSNQSSTVQANQLLPVTPNDRGAVGGVSGLVAGIYLDDYTQGVTIKGNYVAGVTVGIFLHNVSNTTVTQNSVWFSTGAGLNASMDRQDADYMTGNVFSENEFVRPVSAKGTYPSLPTVTATPSVVFSDSVSRAAAITSGSNVFRANRYVEVNGMSEHVNYVAGATGLDMNAADWAAMNPNDGVQVTPATFATSAMIFGAELVPGGDFSNGLGSWHYYFGSTGGSYTYLPSQTGCTGGCMQLTSATRGDMLYSPPFSMTPGIPHVYTYRAVFSGDSTVGDPYISRAGTPWDQMQDASGFASLNSRAGAAGTSATYQAYFIPKSSDPAQVNLQVWTMGVPVAFDNVSIKPITGFNFAAQSDWAQSAHAKRSAALTVDCSTLGWSAGCSAIDTSGAAISLPYTLPAGTSKLFLRADSVWRR